MDELANREYRLVFYQDFIRCMLKGGISLSRARAVLKVLYIYYSDDFTEEQLEEEVMIHHNLLLEKDGYKQKRNIQQEIENVLDFRGNGIISLTDFYNDLKLETKEEKSACRMALNRLAARKKIEKIESGRTGMYRTIEYGTSETKFLTAPVGEFDIKLPLGLNTMCKIYPKNIIIVSGSKSAGKTCLLLSTALANQNKMPVVYMNSEMGDEEFTDRMLKLGCSSPDDIKFKIYNKTSDYHDMVNGDHALYIVDFLEIHDKFYEIGKPIRAIHEKLNDGVAIIAIQMRSGTTIGRGGDFSKEKARLYLAMDYIQSKQCTRITIEEMKSPKNENGYKGWYRDVKIIDGSRLSPLDNWNNIVIEEGNEKKAPAISRRF